MPGKRRKEDILSIPGCSIPYRNNLIIAFCDRGILFTDVMHNVHLETQLACHVRPPTTNIVHRETVQNHSLVVFVCDWMNIQVSCVIIANV